MVLLAVPRQRAQRAEGSPAQVAAQGVGDRVDVAGGGLAQVVVSCGPFDQHRVGGAHVAADGVDVAGLATGPAVPQHLRPVADVGCDARGQVGEFVLQPGVEGPDSVIEQQSHLGQHFGDPVDADPIAVQHADEVRVVELLAVAMSGQQDDQRAVQFGGQLGVPASAPAQRLGDPARPDQRGAGGLGVPGPVESPAGPWQVQL
jgi:hypothetical protein